ncbi:MAG: hypothetical protein LKE39_06070 [Sphaerochaeta sp.]|jgi:hypothetical protein|nr:hypothetical protein [Sphaerochaeta sp.]MCH3920025.1 hypothetical protein [Sphaerochaeta sp.]MCI2045270.1 hypothetical protein [Sphaerochaeta sp.]MCI2076975.1 hypothetical protein [Sphaerochaeta sp.]MCI2097014.1 hypothetical protein [Sphaerochaeta sp.]
MKEFLIGLGLGGLLTLVVAIAMSISNHRKMLVVKAEKDKYKQMVTDRMDIEAEGLSKLKAENESLKKANENLRITVNTYSQKPGRKEISRLQVYQLAVDRLTINSPGFGAAWQAALKESEDEFQKTYVGVQPFIRRLIPMKTDAAVLPEKVEVNDDEDEEKS